MQYLVGIDEAGRGPLAGPVAVGAVALSPAFDFSLVEGVKDSKQLTAGAREAIYKHMQQLQRALLLDFAVSFASAAVIDSRGIVPAIRSALARSLAKLRLAPGSCEVRLDGNLYAPTQFTMQRTIIRGDETEPVISLASIAAKVERDRYMVRLARRYPAYAFDVHKGYGTKTHRELIARHGVCPEHRATFCANMFARILQNSDIVA